MLVLLLATIALGVVRLGLARAATVLALLDGATLGVDVVQFALCETGFSSCFDCENSLRVAEEIYHCGCNRSLDGP